VGVLTTPVIVEGATVDAECLDAVRETAGLLADLGHTVDEAPVPFPAQRWASFEAIWSVLAAAIPVPSATEHLLVPLTRWLRDGGSRVSGVAYAQAIATMQTTSRDTARAWAGYDVILSPTLARLPARVGELRDDADPAADFLAQSAYTPWTSVWNLTGRPAMSLPLHRAVRAGVTLPVGVMFGGRHGDEETLLALAAQLEAARPWRAARPPAVE
jgi:amidase